jgi:hypothetical protein
MRSLILILGYLSKDILRNWFENLGSFFARFSITLFLCLLYVLTNVVFLAFELELEKKIKSIGLSTIYLRVYENNRDRVVPKVEQLFAPLAKVGNFVPFYGTYLSAKLEKDRSCRVVVFNDLTIAGLSKLIPDVKNLEEPYFLLTSDYPSGLKKKIFIREMLVDAEVFKMPAQLSAVSNNQSLLFLYDKYVQDLFKDALSPCFIFFGNDHRDNEKNMESIKAVLSAENIQGFDLTSPIALSKEIEELRQNRLNVQIFFGLGIAWLLFLSYGSSAVFEFRQNLFVTALLKSFGVSPLFLMLRYFVEGLLIAFAGFYASLFLAELMHVTLFELLKISILGHERELLKLFLPLENLFLSQILFISVFIGITPVVWALRKPVGETLS